MTGIIARYHSWLDLPDLEPVTLGEGMTPLIGWGHWGQSDIFLKLEGSNPTGSFKDRGMTVAVSVARHQGAEAVICASTGNTAASAAAYAARAGMLALVVMPDGQVAEQKILQSRVHGAILVSLDGNFDHALAEVRRAAAQNSKLALVNSVNPWRLRGQETGAYEVVDALGHAPAALVLPVGNAGNISAYFHGFRRYQHGVPQMFGIQAAGASAMVQGRDIDEPHTIATAIRIGKPASRHLAEEAVTQSRGAFLGVSDEEILLAQKELAHGGVFAEPASATAYAGLKRLREQNRLPAGPVVVVLTGNGLKDATTPLSWATSRQYRVCAEEIDGLFAKVLDEAESHVAH
ncbi:threonine synthase [Sulfobacillus harzensis]|uniref:Threonine synthase n=1 Tax=Sulfobacillus harzensis TaxID=2729629 RepID=A0A7Y0L1Q5_9FIRM|nr:threonine synthase [Sulfobacillus harzensis]NMP21672.1 threonine synthase [Sulfobacillus harzensis]